MRFYEKHFTLYSNPGFIVYCQLFLFPKRTGYGYLGQGFEAIQQPGDTQNKNEFFH